MRTYTQADLDLLVKCPKIVTAPPKQAMVSLHGSQRNGFRLKAEASSDEFFVFLRISEAFQEDFSIGLMYEPPGSSSFLLFRCNGPHGDVLTPSGHPHFGYHIHKALEENILAGRKPESGGVITSEYASYTQALRFFVRHCNILRADHHFPDIYQRQLFDDIE